VSQIHAAFVMEQTLGHVTHAQNLRAAVERQDAIDVTWLPIAFDVTGVGRAIPLFRGNWSVRASMRARARVMREHARRPFDVLLFHTQVTSLFSVDLLRRVPTIVSLDATPLNFDSVGAAYGHRPARGGWLDRRRFQLNRDAFHAARALISWSEWSARSLVDDYGVPRERITVCAPGAEPPYFAIGERRAASLDDGRPIQLLFVGGDFGRKGGPVLLDALRGARTRRRFQLHVVTRDPVPEAADVVVHHGIRPNSRELLELIESADVFVLPSLGECLSIALMEAAAAGLPIITTDVGALGEAAVNGESALVVAPDSTADLRAAIERLVDDDGLRRRLGRGGHALARSKFDARRNNETICELAASLARPDAVRGVA
jgi:glycosyltransferase involved in cell wall biosynthesis